MDTATLLIGLIAGSFGVGYIIYGRKQSNLIALLAGILLVVLPFVVAEPLWLGLAAMAIGAAPFVIKV